MALAEIAEARAAGRVPIVVGGTGLYLRALMGGIAAIPRRRRRCAPRWRASSTRSARRPSMPRFAARDPEMAARLMPADRQRLMRASEVLAATGRSLAEWQRETKPPSVGGAPLAFRAVLVNPPRAALYAACDGRFAAMVERGAMEEARRVAARGLGDALPGMKALGLRELLAQIRGELSPEEAVRQAQGATRRYAKRQVTWFGRQFVADVVIDEQFSEKLWAKLFRLLSICS